jgi:hypothetical protein
MTRNTLPVPSSRTTRQPSRTANNQGASSDSPGPQAVNSEGAPAHSTNGPDPTTSTGGAAGEDGQPPVFRRALDRICIGTIHLGSDAREGTGILYGEKFYRGMTIPVRANFHRKGDGTPWVTFNFWSRVPIEVPMTIMGSASRWTGEWGTVYTVSPTGNNHFAGSGTPFDLSGASATIELTCAG